MLLLNAFSLNMLASLPACPRFSELTLTEAKEALASGFDSGVGHPDTAAIFADTLGMTVTMNRATISLKTGDSAIIGQYRGPRLPEGAHVLPEGSTIQWVKWEM